MGHIICLVGWEAGSGQCRIIAYGYVASKNLVHGQVMSHTIIKFEKKYPSYQSAINFTQ